VSFAPGSTLWTASNISDTKAPATSCSPRQAWRVASARTFDATAASDRLQVLGDSTRLTFVRDNGKDDRCAS
jgi:hypothetical protein